MSRGCLETLVITGTVTHARASPAPLSPLPTPNGRTDLLMEGIVRLLHEVMASHRSILRVDQVALKHLRF